MLTGKGGVTTWSHHVTTFEHIVAALPLQRGLLTF